MEWIIVTDSGCDLLPGELAPNVHLRRVPLSILLGEEEWVDGADMDRERFLTAMEAYKGQEQLGLPVAGNMGARLFRRRSCNRHHHYGRTVRQL